MPAPKRAVILRHRVSPSASPMTGSSGVSSTLRPIGSITAVSGILDHPLEPVIGRAFRATRWRVMTVEGVARVRDKLLGIQFSNSALCKTQLRDLAAHVARGLLLNFLTLLIRGRRECQAPMRRGKKCARSHHGHTGITRHSPRNGFTVSFVLSPAIGLFCHRHLRNCFHRLDTSVEMSGPHDFTVRISIARLARRCVHRIPCPTSVTFAKRPSEWDRTRRVLVLICPTG